MIFYAPTETIVRPIRNMLEKSKFMLRSLLTVWYPTMRLFSIDILILTSTNYTVIFFLALQVKLCCRVLFRLLMPPLCHLVFVSSSAGKAVLSSAVGTADATFIMLHCTVSVCALCPWACSFNPALESEN
jgi:hypothetical protein